MRAVRFHQHGDPQVLTYEEAPDPVPGPGQVLVRVRACAMNHLDIHVRRGIPGMTLPLPHILGSDVAGEVAGVGPGVTGCKSGDAIVVNPGQSCGRCEACLSGDDNLCRRYAILGEHIPGGYAELVAVPEANILPKPAGLSFPDAAAVPLVFLTAWDMLVAGARVRPTETVLVWGAGSGVGSAAIQIAKVFDARVIAIAGADWKLERARALGADETINHATQQVGDEVRRLTGRRGADIVFEHVGQATWDTSLRALARGGRLVTCGATSGFAAETDLRYVFARRILIRGTFMGSKGTMYEILRQIEAGRLRPVVHDVRPLTDARRAHETMERSEHFGKLVLQP
ncbi:MAG TPA: zinc-binding dehydrogenase [bacterium]|nr:zinc-binding dehydrogenase [bacterium]